MQEVNGKIMVVPVEVYSRVTGYYRRVEQWNPGKKEEFRERRPSSPEKVVQRLEQLNGV